MMILSIMMLMIMLSFLFYQLNHPLSIGLMLLIQTFLSSLIIGFMYETFWFSYILFLVFIGGMLVLFIYMTSLASNEMFSISSKLLLTFMIILTLLMIIMFMSDNFMFMNMSNYETNNFLMTNLIINENSIILNKLYNYPSNLITMLLISYLFFTLIIVVKITNFFYGPLRMMF